MKVKKLFILFFFLSGVILSQEKNSLGINSGITYSDFRGNNFFDDYEKGFDFLIGISFDFKLKDRLFISTDLNYERKSTNKLYELNNLVGSSGGTIIIYGTPFGENPPDKPEYKFRTRFEYITIPVLIKYFISENKDFYINGGPYFGYLLNTKNIDNGKESDLDFNKDFNKIDLGFTIGFGYNLELNETNHISFELRNNLGLTKINSDDNSFFDSTKTNSLNLILGWNFYL